jgi:hypothetical protein
MKRRGIKKAGLSAGDHSILAEEIRKAIEAISAAEDLILSGYVKTSVEAMAARATYERAVKLRCRMDNAINRERPVGCNDYDCYYRQGGWEA